MNIKDTPEYQQVALFYGERRAARSQVPLIQHINEGLTIMNWAGASTMAKRAYCLHPLFQTDDALANVGWNLVLSSEALKISAMVIAITMEYRSKANAWLSDKVGLVGHAAIATGRPDCGPLESVRMMLIADKIQNYKDFKLYNSDHARARELDLYFKMWFTELRVSLSEVDNTIMKLTNEAENVY